MGRHFYFPGEKRPMKSAAGSTPKAPKMSSLNFMMPRTGKIKHREVLVYDFETKDGESQEPGFTRPFMIGFLDDEDNYHAFWNENPIDPNFRRRAMDPGGCVDAFMRFLVGMTPDFRKGYFRPNKRWTSRFAEIWAHNGGRFDATLILVWLRRWRKIFKVDTTFIAGRAQRITFSIRRGPYRGVQWVLLDSAMLLKMKLEQATELFSSGAKKLAKFDLATVETDRSQWELYNAFDCRGLRDALLGFRDMIEGEGGALGTTAPATAMQLFLRKHLLSPVARARCFPGCDGKCKGCNRGKHCDGDCHGCLHAWIRLGLVGGRAEIFWRWAPPPLMYYDRNSSYPASALDLVPVGDPYVQASGEFFETHARMRADGKIGFVECTVYIPPGCPLPPLPKVMDGKLKFPTGIFSGIWEYDELMLLNDPLVAGRIVRVEKAVWFRGEPLFKSFMQSLYEYRKKRPRDADGELMSDLSKMTPEQRMAFALSEFAKLMMNSLIGKTATNPEREEMIFIKRGDRWPEGARPITGRHENCTIWLMPNYIDAGYIMPQLNARILSMGRMAWWFAGKAILTKGGTVPIEKIATEGGRVYYGDTDAVIGNVTLPDEMLDDTELGKWKREHADDEYDGEWVQPKNYALNSVLGGPSIVHMKGIPRQHQNMRTFMRFRNGEELRWVNDRISQPKHVLRELEKGGDIEGIVMLDSIKKLRSQYDKRVVHEDGSTSAIILNEEETMQ